MLPRRGAVVWLTVPVPDPRGKNPKSRRVVVVSASTDIRADPDHIVVACATASPTDPDDPTLVRIKAAGRPNNATGFTRPTWVNTDWLRIVSADMIDRIAGKIAGEELAEIIEKIQRYGESGPSVEPSG